MLIRPFSDITKADVLFAGGKGASLGEMTRAGIPVPPGFVVLSEAFEQFLQETDLSQEIDAILHTVDTQAMHTVEHASERIQKLILEAKMPEDIASDIQKHFQELGVEYVAVRSSATAEDSASAAWAGQLDSFLNTTEATLLQNVQRCWASLFTPRAIFYRFEQGLHDSKISVAVVAQQMVASEVSGIAFSVHPVTEDRNQLIIEAGYGLGEAIVSGQITPDSYVVEKNPRRIIDKNIAQQERGIYRSAVIPSAVEGSVSTHTTHVLEGAPNEWKSIESSKQAQPKLSDEQILELSEIIINIENHYGFPCDIEWAYEGGKFYIVQSRPITTLTDQADVSVASEGDKRDLLSSQKMWRFWGRWMGSLYWNAPFNSYVKSEAYQRIQPPRGFTGNALNVDGYVYALEHDHQIFDAFIVEKFNTDRSWFDDFFRECEAAVTRSQKIKANGGIQEVIDIYSDIGATSMFIHFADKGLESIVPDVAAKSGLSADLFAKILVPFKPTYLMKYKTELQRVDEKNIDDFLAEYGWVSASYLSGQRLTKQEVFEEKKKLDREEPATVVDTSQLAPAIREQIMILQKLIYYRSLNAELANKLINSQWEILDELAESLNVKREDLSRLTHAELGEVYASHRLPDNFSSRTDANGISCVDGMVRTYFGDELARLVEIFKQSTSPDGTSVKGAIAFRGRVTGFARIVENIADLGKICEGDILVAPETTPDFIVGMKRAAAFVTNQGGITSHAAIVARELRKPCIIGTKIATQVLRDGDLVEVDANKGVVWILEQANQNKSETLVTLSKIYSREKSLFYLDVWDKSDRLGVDRYIGGSIDRGSLFIAKPDGLCEVWYDPDRIAALSELAIARLGHDQKLVEDITTTLERHWKALQKYFETSQTIKTITEAREYYDHLVGFWSAMNTVLFELAGNPRVPERFSQELLRIREKSQEYTNEMSEKFITFFSQTYPRYAHLAQMISFTEAENLVTTHDTELLRRLEDRLQEGCFLFDQKVKPYPELAVTLEQAKVALAKPQLEEFAVVHPEHLFQGIGKGQMVAGEIRGQVAYHGSIQGKVRIVKNKAQLATVETGDIIVSSMTTPDFIPGMQKAAAFVTDEGGVMCHAAIVAREMKKPCIIGTKIATQVLKDGDLVEVDAEKGIVTIIEKSN